MRKLFTGPLVPRSVTVETYQGVTTATKFVGSMRLVLTDDSNQNHVYIVPDCVYDPDTSLNILGFPARGNFFGDSTDDVSNLSASDDTTIKSG